MSEDRITLDPPKPPMPESVKGLQAEPAFLSAPRPALAPKPTPAQSPLRTAVREDLVRPSAVGEGPREKPAMPTRPAPTLAQQENRERARRIARLKFGFYKLAIGLVLANGLFFAAAYLELSPSERFWFAWPGAMSLLVLLVQYVRAFILKGRSLQAYVDSFLTRIEEDEVNRELERM